MKVAVGFSTSDMWFSSIIRFITNSKVSHCYIRVYDEFLKTNLVFHVERTMGILRAEEFDRDNRVVEEFVIDDERIDNSLILNLEHLGKKFNWADWFGWCPPASWWLKKRTKDFTFNKLICVDYILRVLNDAGITRLPYGVMTPEMLRRWFFQYYNGFGWSYVSGKAELG